MPTKKATRKKATGGPTIEETAKRAEVDRVRRLTGLHRSLVARTAALRRAAKRADIVRVETARVLCEGTDWGVFGNAEIDRITDRSDDMERELRVSAARNEGLARDLHDARVRLVEAGLDQPRDVLEPAVGSGR